MEGGWDKWGREIDHKLQKDEICALAGPGGAIEAAHALVWRLDRDSQPL